LSPVGQSFPWRLEAGQKSLFDLRLRPEGNNKLLTVAILEQAFEIEWE
jgi:hypothetical protein